MTIKIALFIGWVLGIMSYEIILLIIGGKNGNNK